jgi:segregation and condensation protein A
VDLWNIPIARITEQYLQYLGIMSELNINVAGEFIVMAATLIEIKSRMMTPDPAPMPEEEPDDPRMELIRQLMEYKRFKEAALALNERAEQRAERFARPGEQPAGGEVRVGGPAGVTLWTLLEAFSKILQQTGAIKDHRLVLDAVPQERIQRELEETVRVAGRTTFAAVFTGQFSRVRLIGTFIAVLELVKQQALRVEQETSFGEIWLTYVPPEERAPAIAEPELPSAEAAAAPLPAESSGNADEETPEEEAGDAGDDEWPEETSDIVLPEVPEIDGPLPARPDASDQHEEHEEDEGHEDEKHEERAEHETHEGREIHEAGEGQAKLEEHEERAKHEEKQ